MPFCPNTQDFLDSSKPYLLVTVHGLLSLTLFCLSVAILNSGDTGEHLDDGHTHKYSFTSENSVVVPQNEFAPLQSGLLLFLLSIGMVVDYVLFLITSLAYGFDAPVSATSKAWNALSLFLQFVMLYLIGSLFEALEYGTVKDIGAVDGEAMVLSIVILYLLHFTVARWGENPIRLMLFPSLRRFTWLAIPRFLFFALITSSVFGIGFYTQHYAGEDGSGNFQVASTILLLVLLYAVSMIFLNPHDAQAALASLKDQVQSARQGSNDGSVFERGLTKRPQRAVKVYRF